MSNHDRSSCSCGHHDAETSEPEGCDCGGDCGASERSGSTGCACGSGREGETEHFPEALPGEAPGEFPAGSTNPCKLCTPLGACLAFKGVAACVPLLHGSQGCATYIRRYCISHYREPIDVASSNFSEDTAVFGGRKNLHVAIDNVTLQYRPALIGIATTCLSETMGENVPMMLSEYRAESRELPVDGERPLLVNVSTPSFKGTHAEGFHAAVRALVDGLVEKTSSDVSPASRSYVASCTESTVPGAGAVSNFPGSGSSASSGVSIGASVSRPLLAIFPNMVSPADLRHLRDLVDWWGASAAILPDYSETLDGPAWSEYERMPAGGTTVAEIRGMTGAVAALEFGRVLAGDTKTAGRLLATRASLPLHSLGLPVGVRETDLFCAVMESATGRPTPERVTRERGRLVDSYVDAHKYLAGKKAVIYGEDDLVVAIASFVAETGIVPVLCASGSRSGRLEAAILEAAPEMKGRITVKEGADFSEIEDLVAKLEPDLLIGSSKGRKLARSLGLPLVVCGFPIHDRIGAQRIQVLGYTGTQQLFDRITNALLEVKQVKSSIGYSYL